jgi:hypothetical protein
MKVTYLKAFIYGDDIICGHNMKELEIRLTHWEGQSKNYGLQKKFEDSNGKLINKGRKTVMKINERAMQQVNRFTYLGSVVEEIGEIQKEINERIRKAS